MSCDLSCDLLSLSVGVLGACVGGSAVGDNCEEVLVTCERVRGREGLGEGEEEREDTDDTVT